MRQVELNQTELSYLNVMFQCIRDATDPTLVSTKSAVFVDKKIIKDLEQVYMALGRIGTVGKLVGPR